MSKLKFIKVTPTNCKDVILCRGISDSIKSDSQEEYIKCLTSNGYNCIILTTLSFKFVNIDSLQEYLSHPESHCGLILTSPRSIEAINYAIHGNIADLWKKLPAYCVGPSTESLGRNYLKLENCDGSHCGNAEELAKYIAVKCKSIDKSLLYPCSAIARDTLPQILDKSHVKIDKIVVYETQSAETLGSNMKKIITGQPQIFVFFSPSTVDYIADTAYKNSIILDKIMPVAIGPITAKALEKVEFPIYGIASRPEPISLLEAIKNISN